MANTPAPQTAASPDGLDAETDLLEPLVQGAHAGIDRLAETAAPHVRRLQEGVSAASDTLRQTTDEIRQTGEVWTEELRITVREHPLAAIAVATAVGWLIGRLAR